MDSNHHESFDSEKNGDCQIPKANLVLAIGRIQLDSSEGIIITLKGLMNTIETIKATINI